MIPGAIHGIGVDVVRVARLEQALARFGERLARRILAPPEWEGFAAAHHPGRYLAKRFAAKEAAAKALGTGFRHGLALSHIAVAHDPLGRPLLQWLDRGEALCRERGVGASHLSISDEEEMAMAFVVLERVVAP